MDLDGDDLSRELGRLAAGRRAEVERSLTLARADGEPGQLRAPALRPDQAGRERLLVDPVDVERVGKIRVALPFHPALLAPVEPDDAFGRLVLRAHQRE